MAAIREFTEFGAGFKLAMRDLELRGAGNVLGEAQHGHIEGIGYELYCKEIERAVSRLKGEDVTESRSESTLEFNVPARIPKQYIGDETLKLQAYKKIAQIETEEDADDVMEEMMDRYGDMPEVMVNLIRIAEIRSASERLGIEILKQLGNRVQITFYETNRITAYGLVMATQALGKNDDSERKNTVAEPVRGYERRVKAGVNASSNSAEKRTGRAKGGTQMIFEKLD